jgi:hypothetical protein
MKANADRYLKGMPIAFVFFINFILTTVVLIVLIRQVQGFQLPVVYCGTSKRVAMLYLSLASSFDSVRQSPLADSIEPYTFLVLLRQLLMLRGVHTVLINKATRHQILEGIRVFRNNQTASICLEHYGIL